MEEQDILEPAMVTNESSPSPSPSTATQEENQDFTEDDLEKATPPMRIQLSFELDDLPNTRKGFFRRDRTSPYILISELEDGELTNKIGKTETAFNHISVKFSEPVYVEYVRGTPPFVHLAVYDNEKPYIAGDETSERTLEEAGKDSKDTLLCELTLDLMEFVDEIDRGTKESQGEGIEVVNPFGLVEKGFMEGNTETFEIGQLDNYKSPSTLKICGHESTKDNRSITLHIRGLGIMNVEKGFFNLARTDPTFIVYKRHFDGVSKHHWQAVFQSEYIESHLNPLWKEATINLEQFCDGDFEKELQIEVWDHELDGMDRVVAKLENAVNLKKLIHVSKGLKGNADTSNPDKILSLFEVRDDNANNPAGVLIVLKATVL